MEKNTKIFVIIGGVLLLVLGFLLGFTCKNLTDKKNNNNEPKTKEKKEENKIISVDAKVLEDSGPNESSYYKLELTKEGNVVYNSNFISNRIIEKDVVKAYVLEQGQNDIGDDRVVLMIKKDGSIIAFKIAYITMANEYEITSETSFNTTFKFIVGLDKFNNITNAYNEKIDGIDEYEPPYYKIIIQDKNLNKTDITSYFND